MTDPSAVLAATALWFVTAAVFYVWTALALSAVFRKSGEEGWKAWVPVLNSIVLFRLGGYSPWLVLLYLVPVAGWVVQILACHRIGRAFGFGAGMTVLAALLLPVWASIVGFGSSRWVGTDAAGPRRAAQPAGEPSFFGTAGTDPAGAPPAGYGRAAASAAAGAVPPPPGGWTPAPAPAEVAPPPAREPRDIPWAPAAGQPAPAPVAPQPAAPAFAAPAPAAPASAPAPVPAPSHAWEPPPAPAADPDEVTGSAPGAPGPISAVPFAADALTRTPPTPAPDAPRAAQAYDADLADDLDGAAGETSQPGDPRYAPRRAGDAPETDTGTDGYRPGPLRTPAPGSTREPWEPRLSPLPESEGFAETSGPVSAVAGAPDAGVPRAARSSVSAQLRLPEIPDEPLDHTIIAKRKRTDWTLIPPSGVPVAIGADVLLLGRRPSPDPEHPGAQLVSIDDGTVSKTHARLVLRGEKWYVTDLHSTNGVVFATVLGTEVEVTPGVEIEAGDRFLLGDAEIRLVKNAAG